MSSNNPKYHRRSIRLQEYDYSQEGAYYITLCSQGRSSLFGEIAGGKMKLNPYGEIVKQELLKTTEIRREMTLDEWVIMPNHVHIIVIINECDDPIGTSGPVGAHGRAPLPPGGSRLYRKPKSLSSFVAGFKSTVTKRINETRNASGEPVWQRNYFEHVIRNAKAYNRIKQYIIENPLYWANDDENPERQGINKISKAK